MDGHRLHITCILNSVKCFPTLELQEPGCNASLEHINYFGLKKLGYTYSSAQKVIIGLVVSVLIRSNYTV